MADEKEGITDIKALETLVSDLLNEVTSLKKEVNALKEGKPVDAEKEEVKLVFAKEEIQAIWKEHMPDKFSADKFPHYFPKFAPDQQPYKLVAKDGNYEVVLI